MSYGAVAALIAAAEWERERRGSAEPPGLFGRAVTWGVRAALGILVTTVVATLATAPFGTYHFQNLQPFGLIGNALALPLVSVVVMPCAVIGVVAFPFGLDRPIWQIMGFAVEKVLEVSAWVNGLSGSTVIVPAFGALALGLLALALLLVTLMASPLRWLAAVPAALGFFLAATPKRYDIYMDRGGTGAAVRGVEGRLVVVGRTSAFTVEQWLHADGDARKAAEASVRSGARCDTLGCVVPTKDGRNVALVQDRRAFAEDCARAAVILTRLRAPPDCRAALVLDGAHLAKHGATAVRWTEAGHELATARSPSDVRPWMAHAEAGRRTARAPLQRPGAPAQRSRERPPDDAGEDLSSGAPN